ncbi:hypothetical protein J4E06_09840 [Muricauda sp. NFXS6]|uniref:hypothetical protein n=1 Tax=Allomuricauda sp. NFXS6 TaxID=2819094 RepID=UPI0032E02104
MKNFRFNLDEFQEVELSKDNLEKIAGGDIHTEWANGTTGGSDRVTEEGYLFKSFEGAIC